MKGKNNLIQTQEPEALISRMQLHFPLQFTNPNSNKASYEKALEGNKWEGAICSGSHFSFDIVPNKRLIKLPMFH